MGIKIISKIRLLFLKKTEPYLFWENLLGLSPKNIALYDEAMTHKSVLFHDEHGKLISNERLEFLGDAVLGAIITELLYNQCPNNSEGFLSTLRSKIVCRNSLNKLAKEIGIQKILKQKNISATVEDIYGNALEALIGAICMDAGYATCKSFVEEKFFDSKLIDVNKIIQKEKNSKSTLLEWAQKRRKQVEFKFIEDNYNKNTNTHQFFYEIFIDGKYITRSNGSTKQQAQQNAAKTALNKLKYKQKDKNDESGD